MTQDQNDLNQSLGVVIGELRAMNTAINLRFDDLRHEIRAHTEAINVRITGLEGRVTALEQEDKKIIGKLAWPTAAAGMVAAAIELIRHIKP